MASAFIWCNRDDGGLFDEDYYYYSLVLGLENRGVESIEGREQKMACFVALVYVFNKSLLKYKLGMGLGKNRGCWRYLLGVPGGDGDFSLVMWRFGRVKWERALTWMGSCIR